LKASDAHLVSKRVRPFCEVCRKAAEPAHIICTTPSRMYCAEHCPHPGCGPKRALVAEAPEPGEQISLVTDG
jgi:ribonucleotide monophosphatase NagD (HAD superfamily)